MIHGIALIVHVGLLSGYRMQVEQSEVIRNIHADRTLLQAVPAAGARHFDRTVENIRDLLDQLLFFFRFRKQEGWPVTI